MLRIASNKSLTPNVLLFFSPVRDFMKIAQRFIAGNRSVFDCSPGGTAELSWELLQSSLRDSCLIAYRIPSDKRSGYSQLLLPEQEKSHTLGRQEAALLVTRHTSLVTFTPEGGW